MKYDVTYSCGHKASVQLYGKTKEREREIYAMEHYRSCPACEQQERDARNAKAAEAAERADLKELRGSAKQVEWAMTLRQQRIDRWAELLKQHEAALPQMDDARRAKSIDATQQLERALAYALDTQLRASYWIDTRHLDTAMWINDLAVNNRETIDAWATGKDDVAHETHDEQAIAAKAEMTLAPETVQHNGIVEIVAAPEADMPDRGELTARYYKDDDFRALVKAAKLTWDKDRGCWQRQIGMTSGPLTDRAAELMAQLLRAGYVVRCSDERVREMAASGTYAPERDRWVVLNRQGGEESYALICPRDEALTAKVKRIRGCRWTGKQWLAPLSAAIEVEEMAQLMDFMLSPGAQKRMEEYHAEIDQAKRVIVADAPAASVHEDGLEAILHSDTAVLEDLMDNKEDNRMTGLMLDNAVDMILGYEDVHCEDYLETMPTADAAVVAAQLADKLGGTIEGWMQAIKDAAVEMSEQYHDIDFAALAAAETLDEEQQAMYRERLEHCAWIAAQIAGVTGK